MKNRKFFLRNVKNTAKNGKPVRIQKREPVILLGYFFDWLKDDTSLDVSKISCNPDLKDWFKELLNKRAYRTISASRLRVWRKHLYCGEYKRLNRVLKYLYSGTTFAILFLFYDGVFKLQDVSDKFYKDDLLLLKRWFSDIFQMEVTVDFDTVTLSVKEEDLLEMISIALTSIKDVSNPYVKNRLKNIREELLCGKTKETSRNDK